MSEELKIQLRNLQRFIDGKTAIDDINVEPSIIEIIFVFRPELSPKPKVFIDEIWNTTQRTNLCNEERQDSIIQDDDSIVGGVTGVLFHKEAHIPNLNIEDILSSVKEGPLSELDQNTSEQIIQKQDIYA